MSARRKTADDSAPGDGDLPVVLVSLGMAKKPNFSDWQDEDAHRIHWAIRILKHTGFESANHYDFNYYICGPFSQELQDDLEATDWKRMAKVEKIDDRRLLIVRRALAKGDDFLLALALAVGMAVRNQGATREEIARAIPILIPDLEYVAEEACEFAEAEIWTK